MMRNFQTLDQVTIDETTGIIELFTREANHWQPRVAMKQEGEYLNISASYGALEIALRPRYDDLKRAFAHLQPVDGLQTARQIGTAESFLAIGLRSDGELVIRPTIVSDATGYIGFNLRLTNEVRAQLFAWLGVVAKE